MDVQFNEDKFNSRHAAAHKGGGLTSFLIKQGIAKDQKGAERILLATAFLSFAMAAFLFMNERTPTTTVPPDPFQEVSQ